MGEPRDSWERWSSSRKVRSETRVEKDMARLIVLLEMREMREM